MDKSKNGYFESIKRLRDYFCHSGRMDIDLTDEFFRISIKKILMENTFRTILTSGGERGI